MSDMVDVEKQVENFENHEVFSSEINELNNINVREDLIRSAVKFLQHPNVRGSSLRQKQTFLRRKGLHEEEIRLSCQRAGVYAYGELHNAAPVNSSFCNPFNTGRQIQQFTLFGRIREIVHNVAIFSTVAYVIYSFYKKFIRPFLFSQSKRKSVEDRIEDLNKLVLNSVGELSNNIAKVQNDVLKLNREQESVIERELKELKMDVATVKGLLVSRKQFPSSNTPVSIPDWQMMSPAGDTDVDAKSEDLMELGSGSSSEHEHATKTSESSLEIVE